MRLLYCLTILASTATAFSPAAFVSSPISSSSSTLYISSWGTKGPPSRWASSAPKKGNPETDIQSYIPEPRPVDARSNIDGTVLISGLVKSKERTDQTIFDLINSEVSAFEYDKIIAFVDDVKFSKKRLLSRSARYTGLLDKLQFEQANMPGALPTLQQLQGVKGWVAYLEGENLLEKLKQVASIAQSADSVENVAILLVGATELDPAACQQAVDFFRNGRSNLEYTVVAVGNLKDTPEGSVPYRYEELTSPEGVIPKDAVFSREESLRLLTELLQLDAGINRTLSFYEVYDEDEPAYKLIKGLRAAGYPRPTEVDHMIRKGVKAYKQAIEDFKTKHPDDGITSDNWWEDPEFLKNVRSNKSREEQEQELAQQTKDARALEIETIAREWAKREYFRQSMAGGGMNDDLTEEEFTAQVWDRAMFEGDLKYRQIHGEVTDEATELADFKKRQERKKVAMLERAKAELSQVLEEENLGGQDLDEKLAQLEAKDDNTTD